MNNQLDPNDLTEEDLVLLTMLVAQKVTHSDNDLIGHSSPRTIELAFEYAKLAAHGDRTPPAADQLEAILMEAQDNEMLDFWLSEIDHILSHRQGFLEENARESYLDQHAALREYLGLPNAKFPVLETVIPTSDSISIQTQRNCHSE
jgi:hypothetical protein